MSRFDELKSINEKTPEKKVLAAFKKAQQCINLGYVLLRVYSAESTSTKKF